MAGLLLALNSFLRAHSGGFWFAHWYSNLSGLHSVIRLVFPGSRRGMRRELSRFDCCNVDVLIRKRLGGSPVPLAMLFVVPASISLQAQLATQEKASDAPVLTVSESWFAQPSRYARSDGPRCAYAFDYVQRSASAIPAPTQSADSIGTHEVSKPGSHIIGQREQPSFHADAYYKNRFEFALDVGWLPVNIPFVFDVFLGDGYNLTPLRYTLVPVVASLRWQINDVGGPWIFRGNWDMTFSGSATAIPRGPETHYFSYDMGIRRNFVPRRGKLAPYFDGRVGLGRIDAKEPFGVQFAQGQNFTFTLNMGSGARYNFSSRYSLSVGLNWMHISNLYLSEPKFANYGINVYGPQFGFDVRLGRPRHHMSE